MAVLVRKTLSRITIASVLSFALVQCGPTQTTTLYQYIESDTTLTQNSTQALAAEPELWIEKSADSESRILLKLPTEASDDPTEEYFKDLDLLSTTAAILVFPIYLTVKAIASIFGCQENVVSSQFLTDAELVLLPVDNYGPLATRLEVQSLSSVWWSTATWERTHSFSRKGRWKTAGGDLDPGFTPISNTDDAGPPNSTRFDITNYFKSILDSSSQQVAHYGMMVRSTQSSQSELKFHSAQATSSLRPYVVSTYTGPCTPLSQTPSSYNTEPQKRVFLLRQN
jgi:hypothetical protein